MTKPRGKEPGFSFMQPKDWLVLGLGSAIVAALLVFVIVRSNRTPAGAMATASAPAVPAATAAPTDTHDHAAELAVPRITPAELRAALDRGEAVALDVRDIDSYTAGHLPGALHIPLSYVESQIPYFPKDRKIVPYCT